MNIATIIVSSWESEGYGHFTHTQKDITSQQRKIREVCDQLSIDCPEVDTQVTSLSTRTQIIADESVLEYVEPIYFSDAD